MIKAALPSVPASTGLDHKSACLHAGKASDFNVAPPAGAATAAGQGGPPPRQEPAELGSRALLEAALVAATLHLLALLPGASGGGHQEQRMAGCSTHLPHLRLLVQQAQRELLLPPGQAGPGMAAAAGGAAGEALLFFDLSQVSPALAAAALEGLALLEA